MNLFEYVEIHGTAKGFVGKPCYTWQIGNPFNLEKEVKPMINLHKLAVRIAEKEGKKQQVSIAQIKEILKIALGELKKENPNEVLKLLEK